MYLNLYSWSTDSYKTIEEAIDSGALYKINTLTTMEVGIREYDFDAYTELLNALETAHAMAKMLGYSDSVEYAIGTDDNVLFQYIGREWMIVDPIPTRKVHTPSNLRKGDLVWSQYYTRLGVITKVITTGDYSPEKPCYALGDVSDPSKTIVSGVREECTSASAPNVVFRLIKIADGGESLINK
jgi:hypothetical protein